MYGLLTGFVCTLFYFALVMGTFLYKKDGRFYGAVIAKVYRKYKLQDNMVNYRYKEKELVKEIDQLAQQMKSYEEEHHIIHPFRDKVRYLFGNNFQNTLTAKK